MTLRDKLIRLTREFLYLRQARAVLDTPPIAPKDDGVILFSMIGTRVLLPYLVAIKSLHARLGRGRIVILDDGTLTASDKAHLAHHLGNPELHDFAEVDVGPCPRYCVWERLLLLLDLRRDHYVVQVYSDTVTLGPIPEVLAAIDAGRDFTLMGEASARWLPIDEFVKTIPGLDPFSPGTHVQGAAEEILPQTSGALPLLKAQPLSPNELTQSRSSSRAGLVALS